MERLLSSRRFAHAVALLSPLLQGASLLPFGNRPHEASSFLLNAAVRQQLWLLPATLIPPEQLLKNFLFLYIYIQSLLGH